MNQDTLVTKVTCCSQSCWSYIPGKDKEFYVYHNVGTSSSIHQSSYPVGIEGPIFMMSNWLKCEICHFLLVGTYRMYFYFVTLLGEQYGIS